MEEGYRYDVIDAALAERGEDPWVARRSVGELARWVERPDWAQLLAAYSRSRRIVREYAETFALHPDRLTQPEERRLYQAYLEFGGRVTPASTVDALLGALEGMVGPITIFFDKVLVMDSDQSVRENRLALLQRIAAITKGIVDLSLMMGF